MKLKLSIAIALVLAAAAAAALFLRGPRFGTPLDKDGDRIWYEAPVAAEEAGRVLDFLHASHFNYGVPKVPVRLTRSGDRYTFAMGVQLAGAENSEGNLIYVRAMGAHMSKEALGGKPVDIELCDEKTLAVKRTVPFAGGAQ